MPLRLLMRHLLITLMNASNIMLLVNINIIVRGIYYPTTWRDELNSMACTKTSPLQNIHYCSHVIGNHGCRTNAVYACKNSDKVTREDNFIPRISSRSTTCSDCITYLDYSFLHATTHWIASAVSVVTLFLGGFFPWQRRISIQLSSVLFVLSLSSFLISEGITQQQQNTLYIEFSRRRWRKISKSIFLFLFRKWVSSPGKSPLQVEYCRFLFRKSIF